MRQRIAAALIAATLFGTAAAQAAVIDFEDVPLTNLAGPLPEGYEGLDWSAWTGNVIEKDRYPASSAPGYQNANTSGRNVLTGHYANIDTIRSSTLFSFAGGHFTASHFSDLTIQVTGYYGSTLLQQTNITASETQATYFGFNWTGLDMLTFQVLDGVRSDHPARISRFAVDDLDISPTSIPGSGEVPIGYVPLPAAAWFLLTGLGGLFGLRGLRGLSRRSRAASYQR
ncbi:VPLPA-CTERM sorting domain-containing protein [Roseospira navarrensis]|uniref:VPLPA-CTERM sorting domain-containing protein n=1 Tax=Roseospira navarrensis TaxID=140058 RepID=A0A7X2D358_9PROT|nr:VPLPA-CTERM sorting domain-containing protein [Roseospira navarrensis]MQX36441.1 VPLPA-CTERM sorting domain-containing protein [Roseospira navarrensis]